MTVDVETRKHVSNHLNFWYVVSQHDLCHDVDMCCLNAQSGERLMDGNGFDFARQ